MSRHRNKSSTLYVRNISDRVRYDDVRHLFQKYGKIVDITMPLDYYTRYPKGYCFVEYEDPRDAEEAQYRLDRQLLFGREIEIEFARGDRKSAGEMRLRDRDRRYQRSGGGGGGGGNGYGGSGGGGGGRYNSNYDRYESRRSRTRSRSPKRQSRRTKSREASYSRSKSRSPHSRSPSPRSNNNKSVSRERSRSQNNHSMSPSPQRGNQKGSTGSPQHHRRSGKVIENDRSRSRSPSS